MKYTILVLGLLLLSIVVVLFMRNQKEPSIVKSPEPERLVNREVEVTTTIDRQEVLVGTIAFDSNADGVLTTVNGAPRADELQSVWEAALKRDTIDYSGTGVSRDDTHYKYGFTASKSDENYSGALIRHLEEFGFGTNIN